MHAEGLQAKARLSPLTPPAPPGALRCPCGEAKAEAENGAAGVAVTSRVRPSPRITVFRGSSLEFAQTSLLPATSSVATPGPCGHECLWPSFKALTFPKTKTPKGRKHGFRGAGGRFRGRAARAGGRPGSLLRAGFPGQPTGEEGGAPRGGTGGAASRGASAARRLPGDVQTESTVTPGVWSRSSHPLLPSEVILSIPDQLFPRYALLGAGSPCLAALSVTVRSELR